MEGRRPLRGAIVGYGFISSQGHVPVYIQRAHEWKDVEIIAVADISEARRSLVSQALPSARVYTDPEILLEQESDNLDFIDIATPPALHATTAMQALDKGLHVLCESPLTCLPEEAEAIIRKATECRRVLFPVHNYKYAPVVKAVKDILSSGQIGTVGNVSLSIFRNTHAKGVPEWRAHWRREQRFSGGGIAMDQASHPFYLLFDWMGSYPTAITAKIANLSEGRFDAEDYLSSTLTFPNGVAQVQLAWTAGVRKALFTVQGSEGALRIEDDEIEIARIRKTEGPDVAQGNVTWDFERRTVSSHWMDASHSTWFHPLFSQFVSAIRKGEFVGKEAKEAGLCIQLIAEAYRSAAEGCREIPLSRDLRV